MMDRYNAVLELAKGPDTPSDIIDKLPGFGAALSPTPWGLLEAIITLPADNLRTAAATALALLNSATKRRIISVQVMLTGEFDRRVTGDAMPGETMSVSAAAERLGVTAQRVRQMIAEGKLPSVKVGKVHTVSTGAVQNLRERARRPALAAITES